MYNVYSRADSGNTPVHKRCCNMYIDTQGVVGLDSFFFLFFSLINSPNYLVSIDRYAVIAKRWKIPSSQANNQATDN